MQASELVQKLPHSMECETAIEYEKRCLAMLPAIIEQAKAHWINEGMERAAVIAKSAKLPEGYQWGEDAIEQFNFGVTCAVEAIRADKGTGDAG